MNGPLLNGVYDVTTFENLKALQVRQFAFDLRGRSPNLITFRDLEVLISRLEGARAFLTFQNDRRETILSFINLLSNRSVDFTLIFRDKMEPSFYRSLNLPFYWMFNPEGDWKNILEIPQIRGILLPLKFQTAYQKFPELWDLLDRHNLDVYLHAESFEETLFMKFTQGMKLSLDLTSEVETGFRRVDQEKLKAMKVWGRLHEASSL
jgi:hypothetical protein